MLICNIIKTNTGIIRLFAEKFIIDNDCVDLFDTITNNNNLLELHVDYHQIKSNIPAESELITSVVTMLENNSHKK